MKNKGVLVVISGPSGAGKGTICKSLLEKRKNLLVSVSATTRKPRVGEVDGINYHFLSKEIFKERVDRGEFLEWAEVHENFYGTPKLDIYELLEEGKNVILEIDIQGALQVKKNCEGGVFIFIIPPSMEELKKRIIGRGSETPESLELRFQTAYEEINCISKYNYCVVNDIVEEAVKKVDNIILAEECKIDKIKHNILDFKEAY